MFINIFKLKLYYLILNLKNIILKALFIFNYIKGDWGLGIGVLGLWGGGGWGGGGGSTRPPTKHAPKGRRKK